MTRTVEIEAPAKVNLVLEVLGRRADGFHDLDTLFQAISLADTVRVTLGEDDGFGSRGEEASGSAPWTRAAVPPIQISIDGPDVGPLESNLAYRAARRFLEVEGSRAPVRIELEKRIPLGAGLGGGSSDAAAVLKALAFLTDFQDEAALHELAIELGSDVPFFLGASPLARGRGRGDLLTPLPSLEPAHLVLALPDVHVSTAEAYAALSRSRAGESGADRSAGSWVAPSSWSDVEGMARNDFEPVVASRHDEIRSSLQALRDAGAVVALLSGSGAASFGLVGDRGEAEEMAELLSEAHPWRFLAVSTRAALPEPTVVEDGG